jgi:hypothetical protein
MGGFNTQQFNTGAGGSTPLAPGVAIKDLLRSSFRCVGSLRVGFGYSPSELADGLFVLNAMLDAWAADDLNAPCTLTSVYPLITPKQVYTVGPGGDFNGPRPTRIIDAKYIVMDNPSQPLWLPLKAINDQEFLSIHLPLTASTIPQRLYYNPTYPLGTATLWPVPQNSADSVAICAEQPIGGGITSDTAIFSVPPGYLDAVRYQLAVRLSMEWGLPLKEGVLALASEALAVIQRLNAPTPQMQVNAGVMPIRSSRGSFNRLTGDCE